MSIYPNGVSTNVDGGVSLKKFINRVLDKLQRVEIGAPEARGQRVPSIKFLLVVYCNRRCNEKEMNINIVIFDHTNVSISQSPPLYWLVVN